MMAKYFSFDELARSETALARGIDNTPPAEAAARLGVLADRLLDPVRELWGAPLRVNSGYRSAAVNRAVGGAAGSQHMLGEAADITTGSREGNRRLFEMIVASGLDLSPSQDASSALGDDRRSVTESNLSAAEPANRLEFDQLIDESGYSWLHISYREGRNRQQILHL